MPNQNDAKVSIAMATFNGSRYLPEQLDSFAKQTLLPFELVVCDDDSTDGTLEILTEFSKTSPFEVRIYRNEQRLGPYKNFLKAATLCRGDWIAYSDQDDYWVDKKIEKIVDTIAEWPDSNQIVHVSRIVDENLRVKGNARWPKVGKLTAREPFTGPCISFMQISGHASVFKVWLIREVHERACCSAKNFEVCDRVANDAWIDLLARTFGNVIYIPDALVLHRRHHNTLSGSGMDTGFGASVRTAFRTGSAWYRGHAENVKGYVEFLQHLAGDESFSQREQAAKGKWYYEKVGRLLRLRADIYDRDFGGRVSALIQLILMNAYPTGRLGYGLGARAFAKDLVCTLFGSRQRWSGNVDKRSKSCRVG
ncbi:glycosyltransferase [Methylocaldum sp. RMAD-M]|uniref:glycosyltransferase n=1 Tax=Methylocaldum sp. RMAD-M TaxID=2806557 RepID=UPI001AE491F8|nr:glycosyltransferase involved in cell wall biosynthesis [Methylocaldum sp. RMAD-M]